MRMEKTGQRSQGSLTASFLLWSRQSIRAWHAAEMPAIISSSSHNLEGTIGLFRSSFVEWQGPLEMRNEALSVVHQARPDSDL